MLSEVIAPVGQEPVGLLAWTPGLATHRPRRKIVKERDQLRDVVTIPAGQRDGERNPIGIDE